MQNNSILKKKIINFLYLACYTYYVNSINLLYYEQMILRNMRTILYVNDITYITIKSSLALLIELVTSRQACLITIRDLVQNL